MRRLLLLTILVAACGSASGQADLSSYDPPGNVEVTFNVLLPENSPAGEAVLFTILDEVTGSEFNSQSTAMESSGEHSSAITISVPAGTLLKYRYTRLGVSGNVNEINAEGQPIESRAYLIDGPGHVAHDMVAAWEDLPQTVETGQVSGTVTAAGSGETLPNVVVAGAGMQTRTDAEGHFIIGGLPQGLHNLVAYAEDGSYLPFQQGALVAGNSDTSASIQLTPNVMASVTLVLTPPEDHTAAVPIYLGGNIGQLRGGPQLGLQADGRYAVTLQLPTGVDIRYKYTLGDGFWNAEHIADGSFLVRQLIIPTGTTGLTIEDEVASWASGSTAPIWFDLTAPAASSAYIQFKLVDWAAPLPMWTLGDGHWAYKLYSPTNFAEPLEYRYCLDAACTILEAVRGQPRSANGNLLTIQIIEDHVDAWQGQ